MKAIRMFKKTDAIIALALAAIAYVPSVSATSLITNGSFELAKAPATLPALGGFNTLASGSQAIDGWTVGGAGVDWIGNNYWNASSGSYSLDMNALGNGSISQTVTLQANTPYLLKFDLAGNTNGAPTIKTLGVTLTAPAFNQTFNFDITGLARPTNMGWVTISQIIQSGAGGLATLTFSGLSGGANGPALDNVSLTAVPLPAAAWLFISALGGLVLIGRRRRMHSAAA